MFDFRSGGRRVSPDQFFKNLHRQVIDAAFEQLEANARGAASSIVDPETGKHADVFVRRKGDEGLVIHTKGSPAFARELEKRLGVDRGSIKSMKEKLEAGAPRLYLAHASEDHDTLAKPLAERMLANGIDVWLDEWEISSGDSLRRKMEEDLGGCTHFLVLLTPNALGKKWVETEIDAGFVRMVEGESRFIGVRLGVAIADLSPFLRTLRCPEIRLDNEDEVAALIADIHGVSCKPALGSAPRYARSVPEGLKAWSPSAVAVAEYLVRNSETGRKFEPQATVAEVAQTTGLPEEDIRLGVLDLKDNALIEESKTIGSDRFWPNIGLFVEFDRHFMDFDNERDAVAVANWLVSEKTSQITTEKIAAQFAEWTPRRLNSALNYLDEAKVINARKAINQGPWTMMGLMVTDRTLRFVRDHG
jgi:hypothetical protein